jgi:hypothetical protein
MEDIIEQAINEANEAPAEEVSNEPLQEATEEVAEDSEQEQSETKEEDANVEDEVVFPKKAVNAISRRDKKIAQARAENQRLMQELAEFKKQTEAKAEAPQRPDADSFDTFDDYIEALVDWKHGQPKTDEQPAQEQYTPEQIQEQVHYQQRAVAVDNRDAELVSKLPDYEQVKNENSDILTSFSADIVKAVYEMDDAPLALYALAKEGRLESLASMSPTKAAMELAKAEVKGQQYLQRKPSAAPAPIRGVKGVSHNSKSLNNMSADEIVNWVNS